MCIKQKADDSQVTHQHVQEHKILTDDYKDKHRLQLQSQLLLYSSKAWPDIFLFSKNDNKNSE